MFMKERKVGRFDDVERESRYFMFRYFFVVYVVKDVAVKKEKKRKRERERGKKRKRGRK